MKKLLLSLALSGLLIFGAGCVKINIKSKPSPSSLHPAYKSEIVEEMEVPDIIFDENRAIIPVQWINGLGFVEAMRRVNEKGIKNLHLIVSSGGGGLFDMFIICDELDRFKEAGGKVSSHLSGIAGSAAVPIYLAGDVRTMDKSAWLMMHPHSLWGKEPWELGVYTDGNTPTDRTFFGVFNFEATDWYAWYVSKRTNLNYGEVWRYITDGDSNTGMYWFNSYSALTLGFAHSLI